jgi:hypothetical protein
VDATQRLAQPAQQQPPYRVTQGTIEDIKSYHQSQLCEYDYVVPVDWVRGVVSVGVGRLHDGGLRAVCVWCSSCVCSSCHSRACLCNTD